MSDPGKDNDSWRDHWLLVVGILALMILTILLQVYGLAR